MKKYVIFYVEPVGERNETWHHIEEAEDVEDFKRKCREYGITDGQIEAKDTDIYELNEAFLSHPVKCGICPVMHYCEHRDSRAAEYFKKIEGVLRVTDAQRRRFETMRVRMNTAIRSCPLRRLVMK